MMDHYVDMDDGARISYQVEGQMGAPVLLLINAIGASRELWARTAPAFGTRCRVIRYDARGHGRSSVPPGEYTLERLGRDALAVLDATGTTSAHVCGISLGGLTAMWLGIHAPERVATLVLANTAARIGSAESWAERIALVRKEGMSAVANLAIPRWFSPAFRERDPDAVHGFRAMIKACPVEGYLGCCAALRDADLRDRIAAITAPTLVIGSTADTSTPLEGALLIRERVRGARLVELDAAHLSNVEQSEAFASAVLDFIGVPASPV